MELQELDRKGSTHLEKKWIGGNVDLGLLLQSSKDQRVWVEGLGDLVVLSLHYNGGERNQILEGRVGWLEEGGGVFIPLPEKEPLQTEKSDIPI